MNRSVPVNGACEFLNVTSISPLISKCQIKVCWVGDDPNRNGSIITRDTAINSLAPSLRGCPIVGYYNKDKEDYEEHNKFLQIKNNKITFGTDTIPYGFVDLSANIWFQDFIDFDNVARTYLMTEGYIWTGQFPEVQRVIDKGNNQSMEIENVDGSWTEDSNGDYEFFIINEAIVSKLCILGEDVEPCFEGSQITKVQFALDKGLEQTLFKMANELKQFLKEGGTESMQEEKTLIEEEEVLIEEEPTDDFKKEEDKKEDSGQEEETQTEETSKEEEDESCKKKKYNLEEVTEYAALLSDYAALEQELNALKDTNAALEAELAPLKEFKDQAELKAKQDMINSFYMLSDEDKQEVIDNINTYSLEDIEAKLSIICVRNKVNFNLDEEEEKKEDISTTFSLGEEITAPAWIKAVQETKKNI